MNIREEGGRVSIRSAASWGRADSAMVVACFFWALGTVLTKGAAGGGDGQFKVFTYHGIRMALATVCMFTGLRLSGRDCRIEPGDVGIFLLVSFTGFFAFMAVFHFGLSMTSAANAGILIGTIPLFIMLISVLTGRERPGLYVVLGMLLGLAGVLSITGLSGVGEVSLGDGLVIISCVSWAFFTVFGADLVKKYAAFVSMAWIFLFSTLFTLPLFLYDVFRQDWSGIEPRYWLYAVIAAVGPLVLSNTLYYYALSVIGPSRVGVYTNLEPVFTLVLAWFVAGEKVTVYHVTGLMAIFAGIRLIKVPRNMNSI